VRSLRLEVDLQDQPDPDALQQELPSTLAHVELELFPGDGTFRPPRRVPRPVIAGFQTARVVGPKGEEIHCDKYGRVKLRFHWDSEHPADDTASSWIRVAQPHTTGAVLIPRVGWEVLVEFLNGDPDQPVCKGRVFNPLTPPPFELPENKTVMAHRSYSSPGGGGVNEMRFEDAAGKQEVLFGAHRDFNITAAHDESRDVKNTDTHVVNGDRTLTIGTKGAGVETVTITGGDTTKIGGNATIEVGSRKVTVAHDASELVKGNLDIHVSADDTALVGNPLAAALKAVAVQAVEAVGEKVQDKLLGKIGMKESFQKIKSTVENAATMGGVLAKGYLAPLSKQVGDTAKAVADDVKNFSKMSIGTEAAVIASDKLGVGVDPGLPGAAKIVPVNAPAASAAPPKGEGSWQMIVHGDQKEEIQGRALLVGAIGMSYKVGGKSDEQVMAARMLAVANGAAKEMTAKNNNEIVGGLTMIQVKKSITRQAGAAMGTTAVVSQKIEVKKSYAIASKRKALLASRKIEFDAGDSIVLKCGLSEVVIDKSGVTIKGLDVKIEASGKFKLSEAAITPNPT
jgi:type VI secretion system secreted protein VgrG